MSCFTPGTRIATPKGERPVEALGEGDVVITRDNGLQEIRWNGRQTLTGRQLADLPHLRPIVIRKGALGEGLPERDMKVSPNHRVLVRSDRSVVFFEEHEVLVPVKHLIDNDMISKVERGGVSYVQLLFDRHQVVLADGVWSEVFQPGDCSLNGLGNAQRNEVYELFPRLRRHEVVVGRSRLFPSPDRQSQPQRP